jgi:hypothetical protein
MIEYNPYISNCWGYVHFSFHPKNRRNMAKLDFTGKDVTAQSMNRMVDSFK